MNSKSIFVSILLLGFVINIKAQNILISQSGTVNVVGGEIFYDAGGAAGNDGNTSYTITLMPPAGKSVCVDFTSFSSFEALDIFDGTTTAATNIGTLKGNYSTAYNAAGTPYNTGQPALGGVVQAELKPGIFCANNSTGALTFRFTNASASQSSGWVGNVSTYTNASLGCTVDITASPTTICSGNSVTLTATGAIGTGLLSNTFNSGTIGTGWNATPGGIIFTNVLSCEPNGLYTTKKTDNSTYAWMQNVAAPRVLESLNFDVSNGGVLSFDFRAASDDNGGNGCEANDDKEGVYVQYSTNNGATWVNMKLMFPSLESNVGASANIGAGTYVYNWNRTTVPIPAAAQTTATKFRWYQHQSTTGSQDSWGIDDVSIIKYNPTTLTITDLSSGTVVATSASLSTSATVTPTSTRTYRATISDGTTSCTKDITITVNGSTPTTIAYSAPSYSNSNTTIQNVTVTNGPVTGTYTATPTGLSINATTGAINPSLSSVGIYTITVPTSCGTATTTIEIVNSSCASCTTATCPVSSITVPTVTLGQTNITTTLNAAGDQLGNPALNPGQNITICVPVTVPVGSTVLGFKQLSSSSPGGCATPSEEVITYQLKPAAACAGAPIIPNRTNASPVASGFNPEWDNLTPGNYVLCFTLQVTNTALCSSVDLQGLGYYNVIPVCTPPAVPTINSVAATCSAAGSSSIANYVVGQTYVFTPAGPTVGAGGAISGMITGTSYTVTASNGSCTSASSASFSNAAQLATPAVPTINSVAATCSAAGSSSIANYVVGQTYVFTPVGPTVGAGGAITGMITGTSYTVTASNGSCTSASSASFSNAAQLATPAVPTINTVAATCSAAGSSSIANYVAGQTYVFTPAGPTVGAGGAITGMITGTSYTVTASNGSCTSASSASFSNAAQLATPAIPTINTVAATCSAVGSSSIANYVVGQTYVFTPAGPTVGAGGAITGMITGTSYTVTASNGSCTSTSSVPFSNAAQLATPAVPTINTVAATCSAAGSSSIANYVAGQAYVFTPVGPTVGAGGAISGMIAGTSYTVTASNGSCTSTSSVPFSNAAQLATPAVPTINSVAATCSAAGSSSIANYVVGQTYVFTPAGPTVGAGGAILGMITGTSYTVTASNGSCTSASSASFSNAAQLVTPAVPTINTVAATCSAAGSSSIANYVVGQTYVFTPVGPTVGAGGAISGMITGTSYTVTASNGSCTSASSASFSNAAQLATPAVPTINTAAATCSAVGSSSIANYVVGQTYVFTPVGPTVGAGGAITGMITGTSYTVTASNGSCTSASSVPFSNAAQLATPAVPTINSVTATCSAAGSSSITNYVAGQTYVFTPVGPTVGAGGAISGMVTGTSYTVTASNGSCTSASSASFSNAAQLPLVTPTFTTVAPICSGGSLSALPTTSTNGFTGTWSPALNNTATTTYTFTPTAGQCASSTTMTVQVYAPPTVIFTGATNYCDGSSTLLNLTSNVPGATFTWNVVASNCTSGIGFVESGSGTTIVQQLDLINGLQTGYVTYLVTPMANGCYGMPVQISITINPVPVVTATILNNPICSGEMTNITMTSSIASTTYTWIVSSQVGVSGALPGSGTTINQILTTTGPVAGTVTYSITPVYNGCLGTPVSISVTVNPKPEIIGTLVPQYICSGGMTNITVAASLAGTQFSWTVVSHNNVTGFSNGNGSLIQQTLTTLTNAQGYVIYEVTPQLNGCSGVPRQYIVYVNPLPAPDLIDGHICVNQTTGVTYQGYWLLSGVPASGYIFEWYYNGSTTPIAGATGPNYLAQLAGTYKVVVKNVATGCIGSDTATVIEVYPATSFTVSVSEAFTDNATITVVVNQLGTGSLLYQLDEGAYQTSNVFEGVEPGVHVVTVVDEEGCTFLTEEVIVIDYPKFFTPNGDGYNDTWNIIGFESEHQPVLYIFDRYGKLLKQINPLDRNGGWDGTYNGAQMPSTDYWFTVEFTEKEQRKVFKSHFSMKR
ncbi:Protein of unknown function precursor; putative adhesin [Flavobacterium indicum GPTSA100-9 = DSM 17447]|uniref:Ig-like domain-containing protein n=1 Tax=Flavobacterium indicum (strain DSM 17447 / CIP 109464 / GPTSA100-9) TaxID=1094466 RepID=H8XVF8_FLAIG|nr:T9SS type B sorting domain-containing protein [Flavobacterium indicum]CCG53128.1 Protein of unknown function precursor; putative adhesin [Flavobacterium indicum GPTSA100-9 = DSM 17447]